MDAGFDSPVLSAPAKSPPNNESVGEPSGISAGLRSTTSGAPPQRRRFPEIDGLRGFLAVAVIIVHLHFMPMYWMNFLMDGFFSISSFVITLGLLNTRMQTAAGVLIDFFVRRTARIFPMYYVLLFGIALLMLVILWLPASMGLHHYPLSDLLPYLFYFQYTDTYSGSHEETLFWSEHLRFLTHTWSLAVEEQFYVIWGGLFVIAKFASARYALALAFIATGIWARASGDVVSVLLLYRLDAFGYGILLALLYQQAVQNRNNERLRSYLRICTGVFVASLSIFLLVTDVPAHLRTWLLSHDRAAVQWIWSPISVLTAGCCAALVGSIAFSSGSVVTAMLRTRPMLYFGSISYALYLIHFPVIDVLLHLKRPLLPFDPPINVVLVILLVFGLSHYATTLFNRINDGLVAALLPKPPPRGVSTPAHDHVSDRDRDSRGRQGSGI